MVCTNTFQICSLLPPMLSVLKISTFESGKVSLFLPHSPVQPSFMHSKTFTDSMKSDITTALWQFCLLYDVYNQSPDCCFLISGAVSSTYVLSFPGLNIILYRTGSSIILWQMCEWSLFRDCWGCFFTKNCFVTESLQKILVLSTQSFTEHSSNNTCLFFFSLLIYLDSTALSFS